MICVPLGRPDSATYRNVIRQLRRLNVRVVFPRELSKIILLADGSPDDIVTTILAHRLDGRETVGICKPEYLREDVIRAVKVYASTMVAPKAFIVVMDQEYEPRPDALREKVEKKMKDYGIQYQLVSHEQRLWTYRCSVGPREFQLIVVVNGLDRDYSRHTIEDHLLEVARLLGYTIDEIVRRCKSDPKRA